MSKNLSLRLLTSFFLLSLLILMIKFSVIFVSFMIIIFVFSWIEFNQMIEKIFFKKENIISKFILRLTIFIYLSFFSGLQSQIT